MFFYMSEEGKHYACKIAQIADGLGMVSDQLRTLSTKLEYLNNFLPRK